MNITRTVFARHRAGYLFPVLLCVKPMSNSFAGIIQRLYTNDNFLLFTSVSRRVAGGTQVRVNVVTVARCCTLLAFRG